MSFCGGPLTGWIAKLYSPPWLSRDCESHLLAAPLRGSRLQGRARATAERTGPREAKGTIARKPAVTLRQVAHRKSLSPWR